MLNGSNEIAAIGFAMAMTLYALLTALLLSRWKNSSISPSDSRRGRIHRHMGCTTGDARRRLRGQRAVSCCRRTIAQRRLASDFARHAVEDLRRSRVATVIVSRYGLVVALVAILPFFFYVVRSNDTAAVMVTVALGYLFSVIALSVVEQIYRNATPDLRPSLNYFCVGIGGQFVFDLFAFVLAIVGEQVSSQYWAARGFC